MALKKPLIVNGNIYKIELNDFQEARLHIYKPELNGFQEARLICNDHLAKPSYKYLHARIKWLSRSQINMQ